MLEAPITLVNGWLPDFALGVGLTNTLEARFRWMSFPGLIRGIIVLHFFMFFLLALRPHALELFSFDLARILSGEVWRLISFLLIPPVLPGSPVSYVFIFFILFIGFMMGDSLENAWGSFRTSLYCYGLFLGQIVANCLLGKLTSTMPVFWGGILLYEGFFFAFATMFPRYEFRAMLLFPIPVFVLALINVVAGLLFILSTGPLAPFVIMYFGICYFPYLVWGIPKLVRYLQNRSETIHRQAEFRAKSLPAEEAFHTCQLCGATDLTDPDREFRITSEDIELCEECLDYEVEDDP